MVAGQAVASGAPDVFTDGAGQTHTLADFQGKRVLLNLWATWCGPCVKELPALDRLQRDIGSKNFQVVAVSVDRGSIEPLRQFFADKGISQLVLYHDPQGALMRRYGGNALPLSILLDETGEEIDRVTGDPNWDDADVRATLIPTR